MPKESGYYGTQGDYDKYHSIGKYAPAVLIQVVVVRTSAGWIRGKEHFNWQVGVFDGLKRWYGKGYSEVQDKQARQYAEADASNLAAVLGRDVTCGKLENNQLVPL